MTEQHNPLEEQVTPEEAQNTEENLFSRDPSQKNEQEPTPDQEGITGEATEGIDLAQILTGLKTEYEKEKAVAAEYLRRLQQLQAEYDNFRKRTQREKEDLAKYATEKLITELLPVLDNFERGITASKKTQDFDSLIKGVEMVQRQMNSALEKEGLTPINAAGQEFDPNKHEAVMHVDSDEHTSNTVVDELQKGYYLKDKIIRPSMVRVCK
jgi:molecular chaperone GrpE